MNSIAKMAINQNDPICHKISRCSLSMQVQVSQDLVFSLYSLTKSGPHTIPDWAHEYLFEICAEHKMHLQGVSTVNILSIRQQGSDTLSRPFLRLPQVHLRGADLS